MSVECILKCTQVAVFTQEPYYFVLRLIDQLRPVQIDDTTGFANCFTIYSLCLDKYT